MLGRLAARRVGVPGVLHTFHGMPFHEFQSWPRRRAYIGIERRLGRITDRFLAIGGSVAASAIRLGIAPSDRIVAIESTIEGDVAPVTRTSRRLARMAMGIPPGMKVVGTVGRLDYQKAPEVLVRAMAQLARPDVFAAWVGDGPLRADVERLARELGVDDRVRFLGRRSDVPALLPGFDVFALPSRYEGLPCAIAEAMMCGVPVIATAVNAVPEMVVAGRTGLLIPPESAGELATAIEHLVSHPLDAARMAANASARLGDAFTPRVLGEHVSEAYDRVLAAARRPARRFPARVEGPHQNGHGAAAVLAARRPGHDALGAMVSRVAGPGWAR
jgi:glycosyltransferase involved in cell wall biosynthesis